MKLSQWFVVAAMVVLPACSLFDHGSSGTKYVYPDTIKDMCKNERDNAKACIQDTGMKLKDLANRCSVEPRPGEKNFSGQWGWRSPEWGNQWVVGLTYDDGGGKYRIVVGTDPRTGAGVVPSVVCHEHGHFWLLSNYRMAGHDPRFKGCFETWHDLGVKCMTMVDSNGSIVVVDFITDTGYPD